VAVAHEKRYKIIMKKLYIIKAGTTFSSTLEKLGDFDDWVKAGLGELVVPVEVIDVVQGSPLPEPEECSAVLVTGSHAMVTDNLAWSLALEAWIPLLVAGCVPFLGICYGHQLLARAMGGMVGYHPLGREVGTVAIKLMPGAEGDLLFQGVPSLFSAHTTHAQSALHLPLDAVHLACSAHDSSHAFRIGSCAWGVQFHPEYTSEVMGAYISAQAESIRREERSVEGLLLQIAECPSASMVLTNFAALVNKPAVV
jgi:GMP synthase (glutamine-hydrolysing)